MADGDLTTIGDVKAWLSINSSNDDELLTRLISAASQFIQAWLNRTLASQAYTETRNGLGMDRMAFANYPVTAVSSLTIDGREVSAASGPHGSGYLFDTTMLYLRGHRFWNGVQNVAVTYTAGYAVIPPDIAQACIEMIAVRYKERTRIGEVSKAIGGETVSFTQKDMPDDVKTLLGNYKKVIPV